MFKEFCFLSQLSKREEMDYASQLLPLSQAPECILLCI